MGSPCIRVRSATPSPCGTAGSRPTCPHIVHAVSHSIAAMLSRAARAGSPLPGTMRFGTSRPRSWGRFARTSRWSQGCSLWAGRSSYTPAPTGIRKLDWMYRHEACGAARLSVHFLMFGFSTPAHAQTRLAPQQPRSSAATSSTNVVFTTSEFKTWRWPLSRLSSSQRPVALAHQPGSHSNASPRALQQNSRCHIPLSWGGCGAALAFRSFAPPWCASAGRANTSGEMSAAPPSPSRKDTFRRHNSRKK